MTENDRLAGLRLAYLRALADRQRAARAAAAAAGSAPPAGPPAKPAHGLERVTDRRLTGRRRGRPPGPRRRPGPRKQHPQTADPAPLANPPQTADLPAWVTFPATAETAPSDGRWLPRRKTAEEVARARQFEALNREYLSTDWQPFCPVCNRPEQNCECER